MRISWPRLVFTYTFNDESEVHSECFLPDSVARRGPPSDPEVLRRVKVAAFHVGLVVLAWYWMACGHRRLLVSAGHLDAEQVAWWEWFYVNCFAEFAVVNDFTEEEIRVSVEMDTRGNSSSNSSSSSSNNKEACLSPDEAELEDEGREVPPPGPRDARVLCLLGGGKDSLVVHQMLRDAGVAMPTWLYVGDGRDEFDQSRRLKAVVGRSGSPALVMAHDFQYKALSRLRISRRGRLHSCGHPWAALVGFDAVLAAILEGYDYVAVGNERSANYGNGVKVGSVDVNHQFDKSFAFERRMNSYVRRYVAPGVFYFSALQHLWEVQIAWLFCRRSSAFLDAFISCNDSGGLNEWCCACDKCCFVFALLAAWEPLGSTSEHFGKNLFEDPELITNFEGLLGIPAGTSGAAEPGEGADGAPFRLAFKPFECVGTQDEVLLSLWLAREASRALPGGLPLALELLPLDGGKAHLGLLSDYNPDNLLPEWLTPYTASGVETMPDSRKLTGGQTHQECATLETKWKSLWDSALTEAREVQLCGTAELENT